MREQNNQRKNRGPREILYNIKKKSTNDRMKFCESRPKHPVSSKP